MSASRSPRPALFIDSYFPAVDGVTETVHHYALQMGAPVICPEMEKDYAGKYTFPYPLIPSRTLRIARYPCAVPRLDGKLAGRIAAESPDIFHIHSPSLLGKYAVSLGRKMRLPVVATFHSKYYDAVLEVTKSRLIAKAVTAGIVRVFESCDEVWACSEETGETLRSYGYQKPYFVMPNGTDVSVPADAEALKEKAAETFRLPRGKHFLLFVGQMVWYKNQRMILDAFRMLCDRGNDYFLLMVGAGQDEKEIRRYAESLNLEDRQIRFTGRIQDRDLLCGIYRNADLLFFPSVFDNAPLVLREAAVQSVPTLAAEGSNAAGAIRKDFNGFTAAPSAAAMAEEISRIFAGNLAGEAGRNARETIPLSWEKLTPLVLDRYRRVIGQFKGR